MTDSFQLLNQPRRPSLNVDELTKWFHELSAEAHPDRFHGASQAERDAAGARYVELNSAFQVLKETKDRLLHLIELESGSRPSDIQRIPPGTMDLFIEVGQLCRDVDAFLATRAEVESPMLKVKQMRDGLAWTDRLMELQRRITARREELERELASMNEAWSAAPEPGSPGRREALPLERLEQIYRTLSYIFRWSAQIQERIVQLAV